MVVSSGTQTQRTVDQQDALHTYEVEKACDDGIGFVCCLVPKVTNISPSRSAKGAYACFTSEAKQSYFN